MNLQEKIHQYATEKVADTENFVVDVLVSKNGKTFNVLLDGDKGVSISACSEVSRYVSHMIDEEVGDEVEPFIIEVSSPGVDRPLKFARQYPQHVGRDLQFKDESGNVRTGKFLAIAEGVITLEETIKEKGKKARKEENNFNINNITDPRVVVSFKS